MEIKNEQTFKELLNAGALGKVDERIELELHFTGQVLNQEQTYVLTRTYALNSSNQPVESVKLNMNGNIFQYGSATPIAQRNRQEAEVNKIIKANLPEELSRYFLFDAMEAGNLLKEDRLNSVIKENIENVMGFNRYLFLSKASESLKEDYKARLLEQENEQKEYKELLENKRKEEEVLNEFRKRRKDALSYSVKNRELYEKLKSGFDEESTINRKIEELENELKNLGVEEEDFRSEANHFIKEFELNVTLPKLAEILESDISLVLSEREESQTNELSLLTKDSIESVLAKATNLLKEQGVSLSGVSISQLAEKVLVKLKKDASTLKYGYFDNSEVEALKSLAEGNYQNSFPGLQNRKKALDSKIEGANKLETQVEDLRRQISGEDYSLIKKYEENESSIKQLDVDIDAKKEDIRKITGRLQQFDIQTTTEPDPKFELLKKLSPLFDDIANTLLKNKKVQIEERMKQDLNINLAAYQGVIDRVELSEDLKDLNFRIFHKAGNEIYLNQLNTASMQVVVQVLLKALHEYGDYDPPVMIDTVMGVLDKTSRSTLLENYFPALSPQTILLSSDSEIEPNGDLEKIEPFIARTYTLIRDKEKQKTDVVEGYFNN